MLIEPNIFICQFSLNSSIPQPICLMQADSKKKKFSLLDYSSLSSSNNLTTIINNHTTVLHCICGTFDARKYSCFKCKKEVHLCLQCCRNRCDQFYQCLPCLSKSLDPIFQVKKVLIESYFKIQNIFNVSNQIIYEFELSAEELNELIEIRGIKPKKTLLSWPMTGSFFINQESEPFYEIKPLIMNSNRKFRREEYIKIPKQKLRRGKNTLMFKIYKLDFQKYTMKYQYQEKGLYYFSINLIKKLQGSYLIEQTFKQRRLQKALSLQLLNTKISEIQVTSEVLALICPYTKDRIKIPVRGKYCKHYSCVCLETVIVYHISNRLWGCPICDCRINEPYVDLFIYSILRDNNNDGQEVRIFKDGRYEWAIKDCISLDDSVEFEQKDQSQVAQKLLLLDLAQPQKQKRSQQTKKKIMPLIKQKMIQYINRPNNTIKDASLTPTSNILAHEKMPARVIQQISTFECKSMSIQEMRGQIGRTAQAKQHRAFIKNNSKFNILFVELLK